MSGKVNGKGKMAYNNGYNGRRHFASFEVIPVDFAEPFVGLYALRAVRSAPKTTIGIFTEELE